MKKKRLKQEFPLGELKKLFCIMKLVFFFLLLSSNLVWAGQTYAQITSLNLDLNNVPLEEVFDAIRKQSEFEFFYNNDQVNTSVKVSVKAKKADIYAVLEQVLPDIYEYKINDRYILVNKRKEIASAMSVQAQPQSEQTKKTITGTVTDKNGEAIIGANIVEKGTTNGTVTDVNGKFSLGVENEAVLQISYIGYLTQDVNTAGKTVIDIVLQEDTQGLDELVVVGYGAQKKINLTGSVTSVKMDEILGNRPISSTTSALLGNVPGLVFSGFSGEPGSEYNVRIRGTSSINGGDPLVLVDNIPMSLSSINPQDIESISVLKDASASAVYGARAAFGVILVTTKKSEKNTPNKFNYSANVSFNRPQEIAKRATPLQTVQSMKDAAMVSWWWGQDIDTWLGLLNEYNTNPSLYPDGYTYVNDMPYFLKGTDHTKDMMDKFGIQQIHDFSVSGGSDKSSYRISLGILDNDGVLYTNKDKNRRYTVSTFLSTDITKWMTTQVALHYSDSKKSDPSNVVAGRTSALAQSLYPSFYPTGGIEYEDKYTLIASPRNILSLVDPEISKTNQLNLSGRVILTPLEGLNITGEYTFRRSNSSSTSFNKPIYMIEGSTLSIQPSDITQTSYRESKGISIDKMLNVFATYSKKIQNHHFTVMAGINTEHNDYETLWANRLDVINEELPSIGQAVGNLTAGDGFSEYAIFGSFYRFNYAFKEKYLFEASGRYDGSSKFPKNNRFGFFPSFSAGWRINEEGFMDFSRDVVSNLKLRTSYGSIGNQNIGIFEFLPGMGSYRTNWFVNGQQPISLNMPNMVRSNFTWETVNTLNFGVDLGLFQQKLDASFDIFKRKTKDMLGPGLEFPSIVGTGSPLQNAANMETKGWELQISWKDKIREVAYKVGLNISDNQSKITKFENKTKLLNNYYVGMVLGEIWGYETDRFYTADDFVEGTLKTTPAGVLTGGTLKPGIPVLKGYNNPNPGDVLYKHPDENGEVWGGVSNTADDPGSRRIIGNNSPRYIFGFNADVSWKGFGLSVLLQGVGKRKVWLSNETMFPKINSHREVMYDYQTNYWMPDHTNSYFPRLYWNALYNTAANYQVQSKYLQNAAYLDIKSVVLSYDLPKSLISKIQFDKVTCFISGENLWSFNHLPKGLHPDNRVRSNGSQYPYMRMFTGGVNISF